MSLGKRKLLLIDDDRLVRDSVSAYLEDSGFEVIGCTDGLFGLELYRSEQPDLVITDLRMPGMTGLNVLREINALDPEAAVIVISGVGVMTDVVEALRLGAADFLVKPLVDMEVLVHSINRTLERQDLLIENRRYREQLEAANRDLHESLLELERDQQAGRMVQKRLLPPSPFDKNQYRAEHAIIPSLYLSGDFIDYALLGERYIAFYLTDVAGHGASSAFVTVWLKYQVTQLVRDNNLAYRFDMFDRGTNWLLGEMNRSIRSARFENHLTALVGIIDTQEHKLSYSVAGHLPLLILKTPDSCQYLQGKGKPVGLFADVDWPVYCCDLPEGATLVALSDGIFEVMTQESVIDKESHLLTVIAQSTGSLESIVARVGVREESDLPDDISVLSISRSC